MGQLRVAWGGVVCGQPLLPTEPWRRVWNFEIGRLGDGFEYHDETRPEPNRPPGLAEYDEKDFEGWSHEWREEWHWQWDAGLELRI